MNGPVVIRASRAPALIPCMLDAIRNAARPLILVPESFTLTTEQALVQSTETKGIIGTQVLSQTSLVREIRELAGSPDKGTIKMKGRISSLIELGAGFHPDMSGRENIYINASIFGLKRKEIDERLEDIIRFSELEEFIDNPVRTYSSGMYMRLAFAIGPSAHELAVVYVAVFECICADADFLRHALGYGGIYHCCEGDNV